MRILLALVCLIVLASPQNGHAATFNPNFILSDQDLVASTTMSVDSIRRFLDAKGVLGSYRTTDLDGLQKSAAEIIHRVANDWRVNPRFLMVMMQKEQSIVEHPSPSDRALDWATGYAVCDACSKEDAAVSRFRGFAKQLDSMAQQFTLGYMEDLQTKGQTVTRMAPGRPTTIDGTTVVPSNNATAALYTYTPHIEGNRNFWSIWNQWFQSVNYPSGTIVRSADDQSLWLIRYGKRHRIGSEAILSSYANPNLVVTANPAAIEAYEEAPPLGYPNYSLIRTEDGDVYLLVGEEKRRFISLDDLPRFGYAEDEILDGTRAEIAGYKDGTVITYQTSYPQGVVVRDTKDGMRYYLDGAYKHAIVHDDILLARFRSWRIRDVTTAELATYFDGAPITFPDGTLLKVPTDPTVYVVSDGRRRPITNEATFLGLGYAWSDVFVTDPSAVNVQYPGAELSETF